MGRGLVAERSGTGQMLVQDASAAVGRVLSLPTVVTFVQELNRLSNGTVPVNIRLEDEPAPGATPSSPERFWSFAIAESQPTHLVTFHRFAIDAFTGAAYYPDLDFATGEKRMVPYAEWVEREVNAVA